MRFVQRFNNWRVLRALKKNPQHYADWTEIRKLSCIRYLSSVEKARIRTLSSVLLTQKQFIGVQGLTLSKTMKQLIAAQACIPILKLGLNYYSGFIQVTVYPTAFWVERDEMDEAGVIHRRRVLLSGESWSRGPVILSWDDIQHDTLNDNAGHNVIIHEFSHKIDMLNRGANGTPPLPCGTCETEWNKIFEHAYINLIKQISKHRKPSINAYASQSPVEFFAVVSEYFFTAPEHLQKHYPQVYKELGIFYQQDPARRIEKNISNHQHAGDSKCKHT